MNKVMSVHTCTWVRGCGGRGWGFGGPRAATAEVYEHSSTHMYTPGLYVNSLGKDKRSSADKSEALGKK